MTHFFLLFLLLHSVLIFEILLGLPGASSFFCVLTVSYQVSFFHLTSITKPFPISSTSSVAVSTVDYVMMTPDSISSSEAAFDMQILELKSLKLVYPRLAKVAPPYTPPRGENSVPSPGRVFRYCLSVCLYIVSYFRGWIILRKWTEKRNEESWSSLSNSSGIKILVHRNFSSPLYLIQITSIRPLRPAPGTAQLNDKTREVFWPCKASSSTHATQPKVFFPS